MGCFWEYGGFWKVQLDVRDLGGHLDFTFRARAGTLSSRVREATLGVGIGLPLPWCLSFWSALGFTLGGGIVTVVSVYPARRRTSLLRVVPVGLGDGVGDCHDVANLLKNKVSFHFPCISFWGENFTLFLRVWFLIFVHCWVCW